MNSQQRELNYPVPNVEDSSGGDLTTSGISSQFSRRDGGRGRGDAFVPFRIPVELNHAKAFRRPSLTRVRSDIFLLLRNSTSGVSSFLSPAQASDDDEIDRPKRDLNVGCAPELREAAQEDVEQSDIILSETASVVSNAEAFDGSDGDLDCVSVCSLASQVSSVSSQQTGLARVASVFNLDTGNSRRTSLSSANRIDSTVAVVPGGSHSLDWIERIGLKTIKSENGECLGGDDPQEENRGWKEVIFSCFRSTWDWVVHVLLLRFPRNETEENLEYSFQLDHWHWGEFIRALFPLLIFSVQLLSLLFYLGQWEVALAVGELVDCHVQGVALFWLILLAVILRCCKKMSPSVSSWIVWTGEVVSVISFMNTSVCTWMFSLLIETSAYGDPQSVYPFPGYMYGCVALGLIAIRPRTVWLILLNGLFIIASIAVNCFVGIRIHSLKPLFSLVMTSFMFSVLTLTLRQLNASRRFVFRESWTLQQSQQSLEKGVRDMMFLLRNIVPTQFVDVICHDEKQMRKVHLRQIVSSCVLEADVASFTSWSSRCDPSHVFEVLNQLFFYCDFCAMKLEVEKVKNIGDAWVAFGRPENVVLMGLLMCSSVDLLNIQFSETLQLRVGVAGGVFVAGMLGTSRHRLRFDIFGEAYNKAVELEASTALGTVMTDPQTAHGLQEKFVFEDPSFEANGVLVVEVSESTHSIFDECLEGIVCSSEGRLPIAFLSDPVEVIESGLQKSSCCQRLRDFVTLKTKILPTMVFADPKQEMQSYRFQFDRIPVLHIHVSSLAVQWFVFAFLGVYHTDFFVHPSLENRFFFTIVFCVVLSTVSFVALMLVKRFRCCSDRVVSVTCALLCVLYLRILIVVMMFEPPPLVWQLPEILVATASLAVACDVSLHVWVRVFLILVDFGLVILWMTLHAFVPFQASNDGLNTADDMLGMLFAPVAIFVTLEMERNNKQAFIQVTETEKSNEKLRSNLEVNAGIVLSFVPKLVIQRLCTVNFSGFFDVLREVFVCFIVTKGGDWCSQPDVQKLNRMFEHFDERIESINGEFVKTTQGVYLFILRVDDSGSSPLPIFRKLIDVIVDCLVVAPRGWEIRAGLSFGDIAGGVLGHQKFSFDVIGDTVNLAARLVYKAHNGEILVSDDNVPFAAETGLLSPRGTFCLKGKGPTKCSGIQIQDSVC